MYVYLLFLLTCCSNAELNFVLFILAFHPLKALFQIDHMFAGLKKKAVSMTAAFSIGQKIHPVIADGRKANKEFECRELNIKYVFLSESTEQDEKTHW